MSSADHNKRYSAQEREAVLNLLRSGKTVADVVRRFGASRVTIYRWMHEAGIDVDSVAKEDYVRTYDREAMRKRFAEGATAKEVADEFGCSTSYAYAVRRGELK